MRKLGAAADQRAALDRRLSQSLQAKDGNWVVEAFKAMVPERLVVGKARGRLPDLLRRQDFVGTGPVKEPSGEIGRLADHRVFPPPLAADPACDDVSHGERDMHRKRTPGRVEFHRDERLDFERRAHRAQRIVAMGARAPNSAIAASPMCLSIVPP